MQETSDRGKELAYWRGPGRCRTFGHLQCCYSSASALRSGWPTGRRSTGNARGTKPLFDLSGYLKKVAWSCVAGKKRVQGDTGARTKELKVAVGRRSNVRALAAKTKLPKRDIPQGREEKYGQGTEADTGGATKPVLAVAGLLSEPESIAQQTTKSGSIRRRSTRVRRED
ncbi:hypothetical protein ERJ75_001813400 [Trypanosoma vivax]|nr:hypothetical protein ERJ75_001813400 [Trypanosoma vivax]